VPSVLATDDGSLGVPGLVSDAFIRHLESDRGAWGDLAAYCCGPEPLMRAVGNACIERGIECYLAMERHMACGVGTCQSCVCRIKADNERGWDYKLCCTDGPVFEARAVVW
jgi:dihydroorotate dehydrogenase electron transfer subunit